jgi:hypothetical protein
MNKYLNQYNILSSILFLVSFKAPNVSKLALDYFVPSYVKLLQGLSSAMVLVLMIAAMIISFPVRRKKRNTITNGIYYYFTFQVILIMTGYFNGMELAEFLQRIAFITISFFYFSSVVSALSWDISKKQNVPQAIFYGSMVFCSINLVIYLASIGNVMWKGRLFGVTGHPNFLGISAAICFTISSCLFYYEKDKLKKAIFLLGIVVGLWVCILTGSRTSIISSLAALSVFSINQLPNIYVKVILTCLSVLLAIFLFSTVDREQVDYAGRGNTREQTWKELYLEAAELPIFGKGRVGATTNSYLFAIVAGGVLGAIFFFISLAQASTIYFQHFRGSASFYINICRATLIILLVGSIFEGFLLDSIGMPVFLYWTILSRSRNINRISEN